MGLLDSLAGEALSAFSNSAGSAGAAVPEGATHPGMGDVISGLLNSNSGSGGLAGLVQSFEQNGLGGVVASWVGTGQNLPISAEQIQAVLGSEQVQAIAQKLGLSTDAAAQALAHVLPQAVDHVTPQGEVPHNDLIDEGLALFKAFSARS